MNAVRRVLFPAILATSVAVAGTHHTLVKGSPAKVMLPADSLDIEGRSG